MKINCISLSNQKYRFPDYSLGNSIFPTEADCIHHFRLRSEKCPLYLKQEHFCKKNALSQLKKTAGYKVNKKIVTLNARRE